MFVEYSSSLDANKAEIRLNTKALNKNADIDQIYLDKEDNGFMVHIRMKRNTKVYDEQKWLLQCGEKGVTVKRLWTRGYFWDLFVSILLGLAVIACVAVSFLKAEVKLELILAAMALLMVVLFYIWKRISTPSIALKIFLIKLL